MAQRNKAPRRKRGRRFAQEIEEQVAEALKQLQELALLDKNLLGRLASIRKLAEGKYRAAIFPTGFALRAALLEAVNVVVQDLGAIPGYRREVKFIQELVRGRSVSQISREFGLSREHVARTVQPRALDLVSRAFLLQVNGGESVEVPVPKGRSDSAG